MATQTTAKDFECPKCGSKNTDTTVIATTRSTIKFVCADCDHEFRIDNELVGLPKPVRTIAALHKLGI